MGGQEVGTTTNAEKDEMFPVPKTIFDLEVKEHQYSFDSTDFGGAGPETQKAMSRYSVVVPVNKIKNLNKEQIDKKPSTKKASIPFMSEFELSSIQENASKETTISTPVSPFKEAVVESEKIEQND